MLIVSLMLLFPSGLWADSGDSFLPTWKFLNAQEKRQFLAGYLYAWRDAAEITGIAAGYVRENPDRAIETLEKIKTLYQLSGAKPDDLVKNIETFYSNPDNHAASLSSAISAARAAQE